MSLWMVRAGRHGEHEKKFLEEKRVYLTWGGLNRDLSEAKTKAQLRKILLETYPEATKGQIASSLGQVWAFSKLIKPGDWIALPSKLKPAIHIAEVMGTYTFDAVADNPFYHHVDVRWIAEDVPRTNFDQDLLYSLGAAMTICQIQRNNAEKRIRSMASLGWASSSKSITTAEGADETEEAANGPEDLVQAARDQIAKEIIRLYKGHGMERLVDAVLRAQGYTTFLSPEGPDKGVDILAAPGAMGFGEPRVCVQVKSGDTPLDRPTLDQLIGVMQNFQASHGLLVSWGGFKSSVDREEAIQFFRVRLWDQSELIDQILANYGNLDEDVKAELPLKRIWVIARPSE